MTLAAGSPILIADMQYITPYGVPIPSLAHAVPTGYGLCDGTTTYSRTTYSMCFAALTGSGTFTVTIASPGVFTKNSHGFVAGTRITFTTTGALPTGLSTNTYYYVLSTSLTANTFRVSLSPEGAVVNTSGSQSGTHTVYNMSACGKGNGSSTFTLPDLQGKTISGIGAGTITLDFQSGAVDTTNDWVTIPNYIFPSQGQAVVLTTTGALPTGLSLATTYYIVRVTSTTIGFASSLANANAGTLIDLTAVGSGVSTMTFTTTNQTVIGDSSGENSHAVATSEMPSHNHDPYKATGGGSTKNAGWRTGTGNTDAWSNDSSDGPTGTKGGGGLHNNMPPNMAVKWIMRIANFV